MKKNFLTLITFSACYLPFHTLAADYSKGISENDTSWYQFNLMQAINELPGKSDHEYLELEFGGRSGFLDVYGYVDVFNLTNNKSSDKNGSEKTFIKLNPRFSLDAITENDLSFGPVQELYLATLFNWSGNAGNTGVNGEPAGVNQAFLGIGSDVNIPWLGKTGLNLYTLYDMNQKQWNGYQVSTNWFKPFYFFENKSFITYQGYIDYQFGARTINIPNAGSLTSSNGGAMFNGLYWHSRNYAVGYGLKLYKDIYTLRNDGIAGKTTGLGHYFSFTYKI